MATWTTIPDSSLEPGKPIRSIDALALRDNPQAIAEGATSAPRILLGALEVLAAGTTIRSRTDDVFSNDTSTYSVVSTWGLIQSGTVRITFEHKQSISGGATCNAQVVRYRNGTSTVLSTFSVGSTTFTARSLDVSVVPGDTIIVQHNSTAGLTSQIRYMRLQTNGEKWWPAPTYQRVE